MTEDNDIFELNGTDYVMDLIAETEASPTSTCNSYFLTSADRSKPRKNASRVHDASQYNVIDVELMRELAMDRGKKPARFFEWSRSGVSRIPMRKDDNFDHSIQSLDRNKIISLSQNSRLNQRYLDTQVQRSNSVKMSEESGDGERYVAKQSKVSPGDASIKTRSMSMQELDLSSSALNERYFFNRPDMQKSTSVTSKTDSQTMLKPANDRCFMDPNDPLPKSAFMSSMVRPSSRSSSSLSSEGSDVQQVGHQTSDPSSISARYIKYPGKNNGRGHHFSKAYIDRRISNELDNYNICPKSSAMSDTSEAPSLASHVRNVKIPSVMSDLDQYLDDLFNPVLDGNLDELSDARSLAASIKGGTKPSTVLESLEIETSEVSGLCGSSSSLERKLKGGGVRPGVPSQINIRKVRDSNSSSASSGMNVHIVGSSKVIQDQLAQQQMIQRAFLTSAVQQNLQMQQQLHQQNEALEKLLESNPNDEVALASLSSLMQQGIDSGISLSTAGGMSPSSTSIQPESGSLVTPAVRSSRPPPPPPPPPPSPPPVSPTGNLPDVYGRAKTVRIGKWRWPPAREEPEEKQSNSYLEFRMKKQQEKVTPALNDDKDQHHFQTFQSNQPERNQSFTKPLSSIQPKEKEGDIFLLKNKAVKALTPQTTPGTSLNNHSAQNTEVSSSNSPSFKQNESLLNSLEKESNVGKLRISLEMKTKLEQLTTDQSVRSKPTARERLNRSMDDLSDSGTVKKLSEQRKSLLEQQLLGSMRIPGGVNSQPQTNTDPVIMARSHEIIPTESDGLVRVEGRFARNRRETRERRDDLGPRKNLGTASTKAECGDDMVPRGLPESFFDDTIENNGSISSSRSGVKRMSIPPPPPPRQLQQELYTSSNHKTDMTPLVIRKRDAPPLPGNMKIIPNDKIDIWSEFGESDFLSTVGCSTVVPEKGHHNEVTLTKTKLCPSSPQVYLTYDRVNWELRLRKEFFFPGEKVEDPMALNLIFCQVVRDAFCSHLIRLGREDRDQLQALLRNYGITKENVSSGSHKLTIQRRIVDFAKELPTYFARLYPVSGGKKLPSVNLLGVSHSGLKFVSREKELSTSNDILKVVEALQ